MLSLAFRISQAMGLPREVEQPTVTPFWREIRRRVFNGIGTLDGQSAADRGTEPLIFTYEADPHMTPEPLNINDEDLSLDSQADIQQRVGITDTTFSLLCRYADNAAAQLYFNPVPQWRMSDKLAYDWETRRNFALEFRQKMHDKFLRYCDTNIAYVSNPFSAKRKCPSPFQVSTY